MKYLGTAILVLCIMGVSIAQPGSKGPKKTTQNAPEMEEQVAQTNDPSKKVVGDWLFVSAMAGEEDRSSKYFYGFMDGMPRKMTMNSDGTVIYESIVVETAGITEATWATNKSESNDNYYLVLFTAFKDGSKSTSNEKILVADGEKLVFGKRMTVAYIRFKE